MKYSEKRLRDAHKHCTKNKKAIEASKTCACFYCLKTFSPKDIKEWTDGGLTAICPCMIDSVLPSSSGLPIGDQTFLEEMHEFWFGPVPECMKKKKKKKKS